MKIIALSILMVFLATSAPHDVTPPEPEPPKLIKRKAGLQRKQLVIESRGPIVKINYYRLNNSLDN